MNSFCATVALNSRLTAESKGNQSTLEKINSNSNKNNTCLDQQRTNKKSVAANTILFPGCLLPLYAFLLFVLSPTAAPVATLAAPSTVSCKAAAFTELTVGTLPETALPMTGTWLANIS